MFEKKTSKAPCACDILGFKFSAEHYLHWPDFSLASFDVA
jgi:hypothetical protein